MTGRRHRVIWWILTVVFVVGLSVSMVVGAVTADGTWTLVPAFVAYGAVGALITARREGNVIGWVFLSIGALAGLLGLASMAVESAAAHVGVVPWWGVLGAWYYSWFWFPLIFLCTTFTVLNFPDGLPSPRWRPVQWLAIASVAAMTVMAALSPTLLLSTDGSGASVDNPLAPAVLDDWQPVGSVPFAAAALLSVGCGLAAAVSVVIRARRATGVERLQLRWFAFSVALFVPLLLLTGDGSLLRQLPLAFGLAFVPVSCGVAILRYRLYDIDRIISRTTAYVVVTGVLVAVYATVVAALGQLLPGSSSLTVAAATLAAAALFRPVLARVQASVDRRFNRSRYDSQQTVEAFAVRLREAVDPELVSAELLGVIDGTVAPAHASLWLRAR